MYYVNVPELIPRQLIYNAMHNLYRINCVSIHIMYVNYYSLSNKLLYVYCTVYIINFLMINVL